MAITVNQFEASETITGDTLISNVDDKLINVMGDVKKYLETQTQSAVTQLEEEVQNIDPTIYTARDESVASADAASTSEQNAAGSASAASNSAMAAATSESNAAGSASAASNSATAAATSESSAAGSATAAQLDAWEAEAKELTGKSYATEPEDTFVKVYTSNGDGTFTATDTTEYSALHYKNKAQAIVGGVTADNVTFSGGETLTEAREKGMRNTNNIGDFVVPDNTNALLINPVEFDSLTIGDNAVLKLI